MNIFLIRCVLKAQGSRRGLPKRIYEYIPYWIISKAQGSRPGASKRIYEYIPC